MSTAFYLGVDNFTLLLIVQGMPNDTFEPAIVPLLMIVRGHFVA
jgi:hypothetical protein